MEEKKHLYNLTCRKTLCLPLLSCIAIDDPLFCLRFFSLVSVTILPYQLHRPCLLNAGGRKCAYAAYPSLSPKTTPAVLSSFFTLSQNGANPKTMYSMYVQI
jgi:hypothetical protein